MKLDVVGTPAPKGSARAILIGKIRRVPCSCRALNVPSGSNANRDALVAWARAVRQALGRAVPTVDVALAVTITFWLARPAGHYRANGQIKPSAPK